MADLVNKSRHENQECNLNKWFCFVICNLFKLRAQQYLRTFKFEHYDQNANHRKPRQRLCGKHS